MQGVACKLGMHGRCHMQVIDVCIKANPRLLVKRARFSALVRAELERSVQTLGAPDENASKAVDARQEIDLRIGASFTRFQTLLLQACTSLPGPCFTQAGASDSGVARMMR